jgi:hypothetical protein
VNYTPIIPSIGIVPPFPIPPLGRGNTSEKFVTAVMLPVSLLGLGKAGKDRRFTDETAANRYTQKSTWLYT